MEALVSGLASMRRPASTECGAEPRVISLNFTRLALIMKDLFNSGSGAKIGRSHQFHMAGKSYGYPPRYCAKVPRSTSPGLSFAMTCTRGGKTQVP